MILNHFGIGLQFGAEVSDLEPHLTARILGGELEVPTKKETFRAGQMALGEEYVQLGTGWLEPIRLALEVDELREPESEYYSSDAYSRSLIVTPKHVWPKRKYPDVVPMRGKAGVGIFDYEVRARYPANREALGTVLRWKPLSFSRFHKIQKAGKEKTKVLIRLLQLNSFAGYDDPIQLWAYPSMTYVFALVDRDANTAVLAEEFEDIGSESTRLVVEDLALTFPVPELPRNGEIVILQQRLRHYEMVPFSFDLPKWEEGME